MFNVYWWQCAQYYLSAQPRLPSANQNIKFRYRCNENTKQTRAHNYLYALLLVCFNILLFYIRYIRFVDILPKKNWLKFYTLPIKGKVNQWIWANGFYWTEAEYSKILSILFGQQIEYYCLNERMNKRSYVLSCACDAQLRSTFENVMLYKIPFEHCLPMWTTKTRYGEDGVYAPETSSLATSVLAQDKLWLNSGVDRINIVHKASLE